MRVVKPYSMLSVKATTKEFGQLFYIRNRIHKTKDQMLFRAFYLTVLHTLIHCAFCTSTVVLHRLVDAR